MLIPMIEVNEPLIEVSAMISERLKQLQTGAVLGKK
jgi:hypothetical protein